jgi:hypothetical protein
VKEALPESLTPDFSNHTLVELLILASPSLASSTEFTETSEAPALKSTTANLTIPVEGI